MSKTAYLEKQAANAPVDAPAEPPRLPDPRDLGHSLTGLVNAVARGIEEQLAEFNLSSVEYTILSICLNSGTTTVTELGKVIPIDRGRISRLANLLYDRGLLLRQRDRKDRRVVHLRLSQMGERLAPELVQRVRQHNAMLLEGVTEEEMSKFIAVTRKIVVNRQRSVGNRNGEEKQALEEDVYAPE